MKNIQKPTILRKLRNGEHFQIHSDLIVYLEEPIGDFTVLSTAFTTYKQLFDHEDVVFKHQSKMVGTQAVIAADKKRNDEYRSLRMAVKSGLRSIDPEIQVAAEVLLPVVDNYKWIPRKSYKETTAYITNLIQDLKAAANQPSVTKLSLGPAVDLLEAANLAFRAIYSQRTSWWAAQRLQGNMEMARPPVDEAFEALTYLINSIYATNEVDEKDAEKRTKLTAIINEVNGQLDNMAREIAYRQPGGGTDPDPDPHPEPEPGPIVPYRFTARSTMLVNGRTLLVTPTDFDEFAAFIDVRMIGGIMDFHPDGRSNRFTLDEISYDETDSTPMGLRFIPTDDQDLLGTLYDETYTVEVVKDDVVVLTIDEVKEPEGLA
jgi:hypothetical protein